MLIISYITRKFDFQFFLLILYVLSFIVSITGYVLYNIHMFQLNSYKPKVQLSWLKKNKNIIIRKSIYAISMLPFLLISHGLGMIYAFAANLIISYMGRPKYVKKPLVYTSRIKRLLFTIYFLLLIFIILTSYVGKEEMLIYMFPLFYLFTPFIILLGNLINQPIELAIKRWYINDAKKILKSMPNLIVIGVTGSYGKTSVKFFLSKLLSAEYNVLHTPESYNTPMGVVKTIRNDLKAYHQIFICEMGAKKVGDIKEICDIVHPNHGIITSIGPQHLESFLTIDNVIKTKFELADSLPENGLIFLNYDNEYIRNKEGLKNVVSYGLDQDTSIQYKAYNLRVSPMGTQFSMKDADGVEYVFHTKLIGKHNVENVAGAIAVANRMGISMEKLIMQVRQLNAVEHRLQLIKRKDFTIIDDAFNSNPSGAKAALETLSLFDGFKVIITPGMIELGSRQYECNKTFGLQIAEVCDYVILVGEAQTKPIYDGLMEAGYDKDRIFVASDIKESFQTLANLKSDGKEKIVLLENDLPDNY